MKGRALGLGAVVLAVMGACSPKVRDLPGGGGAGGGGSTTTSSAGGAGGAGVSATTTTTTGSSMGCMTAEDCPAPGECLAAVCTPIGKCDTMPSGDGTSCAMGVGICKDGVCACSDKQVACNGVCVDIDTDPSNCGTCSHDCQGGGCVGGACQPLLLTSGLGTEVHFVLTSTALYFTDTTAGTVSSLLLGGGMPTTLVAGETSPTDITVDPGGNFLVWVNSGPAGAVRALPIDTLQVYQVLGAAYAEHVVIAGDKIVIAKSSPGMNAGEIVLIDPPQGTMTVLYGGAVSANGLAVDGANVYFTNGIDTQGVYQVALDNSGASELAANQGFPYGIAAYGGEVFWSTFTGISIAKVPVGGGSPTSLAQGYGVVEGVATDGVHVYFTSQLQNQVVRVDAGGNGKEEVLVTGLQKPGAIAVDDKAVYWFDEDAGTIWKVAK